MRSVAVATNQESTETVDAFTAAVSRTHPRRHIPFQSAPLSPDVTEGTSDPRADNEDHTPTQARRQNLWRCRLLHTIPKPESTGAAPSVGGLVCIVDTRCFERADLFELGSLWPPFAGLLESFIRYVSRKVGLGSAKTEAFPE